MPRGRPKKADAAKQATSPAVNPERLDKLPGFAERIDLAKSKSDDARSTLGNIYQQAEEAGFHRRALKEAVRLRDMEISKRNDYLGTLIAYCEKLGVWSQGDLLGDEPRLPQPPPLVDGAQMASDRARNIGKQDGRRGSRSAEHLYPQGTPEHSDYELGWQDGQRELLAAQHGMTPEEIEAAGRTAH